MTKYKYNLKNLDCANCALKIENKLNEEESIKNARVNFNTLKLFFETDITEPLNFIQSIVSKIEPEVIVYENEIENKKNYSLIRLLIGVIFAILGFYFKIEILVLLAYATLLARTVKNAFIMLVKEKSINENLLITISCVGAYLVGEHMEGLMVIFLYEIGKILEDRAINKSRGAIKSLMDIKPDYANIKTNDGILKVSPSKVKIDDIIVVLKGEKIPLDGIIVKGNSTIDESYITGEVVPRDVSTKDNVLSGTINIGDVILVKVTSEFYNSTVNKILDLVENATDKKAKTETFVNKLAKIYTPIVLILAILTAIFMPMIFNVTYSESIYKALIFLVISCPCAIAISVPLSYFSAIGKASKEGILIKGSNYIDILKDIKTFVFDKTGTLTKGEFEIAKVEIYNKEYKEKEIINLILKGESFSNHPIAKSLTKNKKIDTSDVRNFKELEGLGLQFEIGDDKYLLGNDKLVKTNTKTGIFLKKNDELIGSISLNDTLKENTEKVIKELKRNNLDIYMFTGDNEEQAKKIADLLGIKYKCGMLPKDKYDNVLKLKENSKVAFIGDGINDSPVLIGADIGISMGGVGSNAAIEASSIVIMNDDLEKIIESINISYKTNHIIKQNLIFAISTKVIILLLSVLGIAGMWQAIFADVGVTLITILNTLRILK